VKTAGRVALHLSVKFSCPLLRDNVKHGHFLGGLTVIANAPNPAGFSILRDSFGPEGYQPGRAVCRRRRSYAGRDGLFLVAPVTLTQHAALLRQCRLVVAVKRIGSIDRKVRTFEKSPPKPKRGGQHIAPDRLIAVLVGWDTTPEEQDLRSKRCSEAGAALGSRPRRDFGRSHQTRPHTDDHPPRSRDYSAGFRFVRIPPPPDRFEQGRTEDADFATEKSCLRASVAKDWT